MQLLPSLFREDATYLLADLNEVIYCIFIHCIYDMQLLLRIYFISCFKIKNSPAFSVHVMSIERIIRQWLFPTKTNSAKSEKDRRLYLFSPTGHCASIGGKQVH